MSTHLSLIILRVVVLFSLRALDAVSDRFRVESVTQRWLRETDRSVRRQNQSLVKYNFFQARSKQKSTIFIRSDFFANGPLLGNAIPVFYFAAKPITMPKRDYCSLSHLIVYQFRTAVHRWHSVTRLSTKLFTETWVSASAYTLVWLYALSSWSLTHLPTYSFSISQPITHTHTHSFIQFVVPHNYTPIFGPLIQIWDCWLPLFTLVTNYGNGNICGYYWSIDLQILGCFDKDI